MSSSGRWVEQRGQAVAGHRFHVRTSPCGEGLGIGTEGSEKVLSGTIWNCSVGDFSYNFSLYDEDIHAFTEPFSRF